MIHRKWLIGLLTALLLSTAVLLVKQVPSGRARSDEGTDANTAKEQASELAKFATPSLARAEIERRLSQRLVRDGLMVVIEDGDATMHTTYVLPVTTPWIVYCDTFGLRVQFGADVSSGGSVLIQIIPIGAAGVLSAEKCKEIAPVLGNVVTIVTYAPAKFR